MTQGSHRVASKRWPRWLGAVTGAIAGVCMGAGVNVAAGPRDLLIQVYVVGWLGLAFTVLGWDIGRRVEE